MSGDLSMSSRVLWRSGTTTFEGSRTSPARQSTSASANGRSMHGAALASFRRSFQYFDAGHFMVFTIVPKSKHFCRPRMIPSHPWGVAALTRVR